MYYYFTLTCLGYRPKWKRYLTSMQITQFFVGNILGIAYLVIPNCHNWDSDFRENVLHRVFGSYYASIVFTFIFNFMFVGGLILLFNDFARRTYGQKKHHHESSDKHSAKQSGKKTVAVAEPVVEISELKPKSKAKAVAKAKKEIPAKKGKTSPVQVATSVEIDVPAKASKTARSKSRARSTVRSKSKARAASPSKAAPVQRRTRRS